MSAPYQNPSTSGFRGGFTPAPHDAGVPTSSGYVESTTDSRARNALVLGLLGIFPLSILTGIPAIFVGAHALRRIEAADGAGTGRGLAWCGIVLGGLSVLALVVVLSVVYA